MFREIFQSHASCARFCRLVDAVSHEQIRLSIGLDQLIMPVLFVYGKDGTAPTFGEVQLREARS